VIGFDTGDLSPVYPFDMSKWKKVGKIKDAHGLRGDLHVLVFSKDASWAEDLKIAALGVTEDEKALKTYSIEKWKPFKEGLLLKFENVPDRTAAEKLKGQLFFIPEELLTSEEGETIYLSEIEGFEVIDHQGVKLGKIVGFSNNQAQDLLVVEKVSGGQAEIPFVEDFIVDINFENRQVQMDLPEGIWDLTAL
jgi:16S rRNA processing protein RimM